MALAVIRTKEYVQLLETQQGPATSILEKECELFGMDHCEAGEKLIAGWQLPGEFGTVTHEHHGPRLTDRGWGLPELIKVSCRMADAAGFPAFAGCETVAYEKLLAELPDRERRLFYPEQERLAFEVTAGIHAVESV
jgi:hypothetical protein